MARCRECGCPIEDGVQWCSAACEARWKSKREQVTCRKCGDVFWRVIGRRDRLCGACQYKRRKSDHVKYARERQDVLCPYYKRATKGTLVCEGPDAGINIQLNFDGGGRKKAYMRDFCCSGCWRGCEIAALAGIKYKQ